MRAAARVGPKAANPGGVELVHQPGHQRRLGAHNDQVDLALLRRGDHVSARHALDSVARDPGVARRGQHLGCGGSAEQRPDERVLAAAGADHKDASRAQSAEMKSSTGIAERVS